MDNSISYDKDVLNQRSDPTCNQIHPQFSLAKLFYPSDTKEEEEKHMNYNGNNKKSPGVFDISEHTIKTGKELHSSNVRKSMGNSTNHNLEDLLEFDENSQREYPKSGLLSAEIKLDGFNSNKLDINDIVGDKKSMDEKDELILNLLQVAKRLQTKINDIENTSRANKAMLENVINKKQEATEKTKTKAEELLQKLSQQNEFLENYSDLSASTEGSQDEIPLEEAKGSRRGSQKDLSKAKTAYTECSIQTEPKSPAFPFGCQVNFNNAKEEKIKELENLLLKQEEEFETKLEEAKKMDDVEDAFQAFLDQLDLNENEERIIIDGESRVWKIIRCSKSIIEDECLEEEEEEDEEEKTTNDETMTRQESEEDNKQKQLRNRDRPSNPMRRLDSPGEDNKKAEDTEKHSPKQQKSDSKEGILIVEDEAHDSDSDRVDRIKDELEGNLEENTGDVKSKEPQKEETPKKEPKQESEEEKSDGSAEKEKSKRFPTLSDEEKEPEIDILHKQMSPSVSEGNRDELKTEDLGPKEPTSSAKKRDQAAEEFLKDNDDEEHQILPTEDVQPFEFSEDSKSSVQDPTDDIDDDRSEEVKRNINDLYDQFQADLSGISRSKSEEWGGGLKDYQDPDDAIQPMKLHYTEGDLSNIELVEEESEGEESESEQDSQQLGDIEGTFSDRIQIAE